MEASAGGFGAWGFQSSLDVLEETCNLRDSSYSRHYSSITEETDKYDLEEMPEACRQFEGCSIEDLRAEIHELQESRAANRQRLLRAGQRGQELVAEEHLLQTQLSDHLAALADTEGSSNPNRAPRKKSADSEEEFHSTTTFGGFGAAPSMAFTRSVHTTSAAKKTHKQILKDHAEVDRLRKLNESIGEQIEEKETALRKKMASDDIDKKGGAICDYIDDETRHRLNVVHLDLQDTMNNGRHAETSRGREIAEVERELLEIRRQSASMMVAITKRLEATRQRNTRLKEELEAQNASVIDQSPLHESIQKLRHELEAYQAQGDEMNTELQEARNEAAVAEDNHFEAQTLAIEFKIEAKHHRLAMAQVLPLSHHTSTTPSEDSEGSEFWDCGDMRSSETLDEQQLKKMSRATARRHQKTRLRQRQLNRHLHKDMEVVVHTTKAYSDLVHTTKADKTAPTATGTTAEEKKRGKTNEEKQVKNDNGWGAWTEYFGAAADSYRNYVTESW